MAERWSSLQGRWKEPTTVHLPVSMKPLSMTHSCTEVLEEYFPIARNMWGRIIATWLSPWHYWKWITLQRKENDIRARFYPTCIRESANLICPGGNHLSESKWCHVVNAWNTRDPPGQLWQRRLQCESKPIHCAMWWPCRHPPTCSVTLLENMASRKMAAMGGTR